MRPLILLIGANGQVGRELGRVLPNVGKLTALDRRHLDLSKPEAIRRAVRTAHPDLIVNAAAYTAVDRAESEETLARAINAEAPALLAMEAKTIGASLVHYSTDYVFDGLKATPYDEDDSPNPRSVYGKTKLEGERAIQQSGVAHLIFRTAWMYATRGRNFLLTMLRLGAQREELRIIHDQLGSPTWSAEVAAATARIVAQLYSGEPHCADLAHVSGVYHMTAAGETSWYGFAKGIFEEAGKTDSGIAWLATATSNHPLIARRVVPITTREYPTPARRPAYSVLSNTRLARIFHIALPDWRTQLHSAFVSSLPSVPITVGDRGTQPGQPLY